MIGRQTGFHIMFDAAACRPRSEQCRGSVAVADGWASRIDQQDRPLDAAVIGAGWARLGVSYVLAKAGLSPDGELMARPAVIASGSLNRARRPDVARALPPGLLQIDTSAYRRPEALPAGAVLVVGSAQSGGQIAEDLAMAARVVFLSTGR